MLPILTPFPDQSTPQTGYQKERAAFAKLQADLQERRSMRRRVAGVLARIAKGWRKVGVTPPRKV